MEVRPAGIADAARIAEIHVQSWQSGYCGLIPQDYLDALDPARGLARRIRSLEETDWTRGGTLVVCDDDGDVVGFAHLGESRDEDAKDGSVGEGGAKGGSAKGGSVGEIFAIYLAPAAWGKGLGRELMTGALACLAKIGYGQITLWVLDTNGRARRFYEAAGLCPDGAVKTDDSRGFPLREVRYRRSLEPLADQDSPTIWPA